ncbi:MAG: ferritin-like domain-containing protein [Candidatus Zhuqueibacterota bacterium]
MITRFSGKEIIEMAIRIEVKDQEFYKGLEERATTHDLKQLYHWLAIEEEKHIHVFEKMKQFVERIELRNPQEWQEAMLYFDALIRTRVFAETPDANSLINELKDDIGAIQIAISFEKDSILFFQEMNTLVDDREKDIIEKLIIEEKGHILKLLKMMQHVTA